MAEYAPVTFHFLFRADQGLLNRRDWWRGVAILALPLVLLTLGWQFLAPYANRGLDQRKLVDAMTILTFVYLMIFAFAVILIAVCFVTVTTKRLRARGRPTGLAGLLPLAALIAGAAHWLQPRVSESMPWAIVVACDFALLAVALWCIVDLGICNQAAEK